MFHHFLYTGFSDYDALVAFYEELLEEDAKAVRQWRGGKTPEEYDAEAKCGRKFKLPLLEQFFLTDTVTAWAVGARYCTSISDLAVHRQQNFCYLGKSHVQHSQVN